MKALVSLLVFSFHLYAQDHQQICKVLGNDPNNSCFATRLDENFIITSNHCTNSKGGSLPFIKCPGSSINRTYSRVEHNNTHYKTTNLNHWIGGDYSLVKVSKSFKPIATKPSIVMPRSIDEVTQFFEKALPSESVGNVKMNTTDPELSGKDMKYKTKTNLKLKTGSQCFLYGGQYDQKIAIDSDDLTHWVDQSENNLNKAGYLYSQNFYDKHTKKGALKRGSSGGSICCLSGDECILVGLISTTALWTFIGEEIIEYTNKSLPAPAYKIPAAVELESSKALEQ